MKLLQKTLQNENLVQCCYCGKIFTEDETLKVQSGIYILNTCPECFIERWL